MSYLAQFNYQILGSNSENRFVFLHGLMGYGQNWKTIALEISQSSQVLLFDQRGHGKSFKPLTGYAPEDFAEDLFLITEELGWDKFNLVGHSMGGRNALVFADRFTAKVNRLVIEDMGPEANPDAPAYYKKIFDAIPAPFPSKQKAKSFLMNEFRLVAEQLGQPASLGAYLYTNMTELPDGTADWRFAPSAMLQIVQLGRASDLWKELRTLSVPTLVIRGENSLEFPKAIFDRVLVSNPNVSGVEISNAGHWVHSDQPQEFLKIIKEFTHS